MAKQPNPRGEPKGLKDPSPIQMHVVGRRIYCSDLIEEHQKGFIDALGTRIGIHLDGKAIAVLVKSVKGNKAILQIVGPADKASNHG